MSSAGQRVLLAALAAGALLAGGPAAAVAARGLDLPRPLDEVPVVGGAGLTKDRLLTSRAPGPVANRETVTVAVGGDGTPAGVTVEQR